MQEISVESLFQLLRHGTKGRFFSVQYERRTDSDRQQQRPGEIRTMLCRTCMNAFKKGVVSDLSRDEEDFRTGTLTVWDVNAYKQNLTRGMSHEAAGRDAWRRIDLLGIQQCSLLDDKEVDVRIRLELHRITNKWRLRHMPPAA